MAVCAGQAGMGVRSETWYTSDLHLGHRLVAENRGFTDTTDHDGELARRWDRAVGSSDTVWVLGDISGGGRGSQLRALEWLTERPGSKHLIVGNHDGVHPMHTGSHKMLPTYLEVFASVQQSARRRLAGRNVLLSHFPYLEPTDTESTYNRFEQWRLPNLDAWLLHGHVHSPTVVSGRNIHVGVDAWKLTPVSVNAVAHILSTQDRDSDH